MDLSESCRIFEEFSTALEWAAYNRLGCSAVVHVLDFLFIESTKEQSASILKKFKSMREYAGIPIAEAKNLWAKFYYGVLGYHTPLR